MTKSSTMSLNSLIMLWISSSFISFMEESDNPACAISTYCEILLDNMVEWVKLWLMEINNWWDGHNSNPSSLLFVCSRTRKNGCFFARRRNYSFLCAIRSFFIEVVFLKWGGVFRWKHYLKPKKAEIIGVVLPSGGVSKTPPDHIGVVFCVKTPPRFEARWCF